MDLKKNISMFREYVKTKYKYAQIFSNQVSTFAERDFRSSVFKIKSDLAHDFDKDEVLYIPINLWRAITRAYTDYVIGMWYNVDFWSDELNGQFTEIDDAIRLQKKLNNTADIQSSIGYCVVRARKRDTDKYPRMEIIPVNNYCANMDWLNIGDEFEDIKEHFVFSVVDEWFGWRKYFYVDRYEKNENGEGWTGYYGEKWKYTADFILKERFEEWVEEPLERLPLFLFNNDLTNIHVVEEDGLKKKRNYYGDIPRYFNQSDYVDLADLLQEINDRWSQISVEFIKNLKSKLSVPAWFASAQTAKMLKKKSEWKDEYAENPDYLVHNPWETPAQYITKDATYITTSINEYLPYLLKMISIVSGVPTSMLWSSIYSWWNNPVWTTEKEWQIFYSRVESKQLEIYSPLQKLFRQIMELYTWKKIEELPTIKFKKPTAYDIAERTNTAVTQLNAWIMSKESAMAFCMWYDDSEVAEEKERIAQEEKESYAKYKATFQTEKGDENLDEKKEDLDENLDEKK